MTRHFSLSSALVLEALSPPLRPICISLLFLLFIPLIRYSLSLAYLFPSESDFERIGRREVAQFFEQRYSPASLLCAVVSRTGRGTGFGMAPHGLSHGTFVVAFYSSAFYTFVSLQISEGKPIKSIHGLPFFSYFCSWSGTEDAYCTTLSHGEFRSYRESRARNSQLAMGQDLGVNCDTISEPVRSCFAPGCPFQTSADIGEKHLV